LTDNGEVNQLTVGLVEAEKFYTEKVVSNNDRSFHQAVQSSSDLGAFLSRPVKVATENWVVGTQFNTSYNIWELFFSNSYVQQKIANFHLLSCKLNVRLQINATPFHYGRVLASYLPYATCTGGTVDLENTGSSSYPVGNAGQFLVSRTQRTHVNIDASTNQGGEMCLPFMNLNNALRVQEISDFIDIGKLYLDSYMSLRHAAGGSDNVTITIWAWASDVVLTVPTQDAAFTPQSDEYSTDGIVSKPADTVAEVAGAMADVPIIGPFAMATSMAASTVGSIARLFGFSRPTVATPPMYTRPRPFASIANTNIDDAVEKLTLDLKQELTVDPRTVGLDSVDEMSISHIAGRESLLTSFPWQISDAHEQVLFAMCVTPRLEAYQSVVGPPGYNYYTPTALSFATTPFRFWSGTIKVRFSFVASRYHRGRVRIIYDPYSAGAVTNKDTYNVAFQKVVDLAAARDITIEIPWAQSQPYARADLSSLDAAATTYAPNWQDLTATGRPNGVWVTNAEAISEWCNGFLVVEVLNELTSPDAGAPTPVTVLVSVSAGDDFEVSDPMSGKFIGNEVYEPQSAEYPLDMYVIQADTTEEGEHDARNVDENAPEASQSVSISSTPMNLVTMKQKIFFGESVVSFRSLLRRYNFIAMHSWANEVANASGVTAFSLKLPTAPFFPGDAPVSRFGFGDNQVHNTLLTYLLRAYTGWRGGIRRKFAYVQNLNNGNILQVVSRDQNTATGYSTSQVILQNNALTYSAATVAQDSLTVFPNLWDGGMINQTSTNAGIEFEVPFYRPVRFALARNTNIIAGVADDFSNVENINYVYVLPQPSTTANEMMLEYIATGEDFSLFYFVNAPSYYA
jgi:hypothetical protein